VESLPEQATADLAVTFVAPSGAHVYADQAANGPVGFTEAPTAIRTTDPQPVIGIEADGGSQLQCHFDSVFVTQPCGAPEPGCNAALCASYKPASPLTPDSSPMFSGHFLAVDVLDADGNPVTSVWLNLDVDTAAPVTHLDSVRGVVFVSDPIAPLRPAFAFSVRDGNDVRGNIDRIECSWQPAGTPPAWYVCAPRLRLFPGARRDFRPVRSLDLVIVAGDADAVSAGIADDGLSYRTLTLRR
jgi:hypothetical protein